LSLAFKQHFYKFMLELTTMIKIAKYQVFRGL